MASPDPTPPSLTDYVLLRIIGRGSYGDVWLARGVTGIFRAIKIVQRDRFSDLAPFDREFQGLEKYARISVAESSQLAVLHIGRSPDNQFFYYVMELADDISSRQEIDPQNYTPSTLSQRIQSRSPPSISETLAIGLSLTQALSALHSHGLVHRDVKPSNIVFVNGMPKLADIGLVATANADLSIVGTEGYLAPEGPGLPAADIFALGKVLYELSTGLNQRDFPRLPADLQSRSDRIQLLELNEVILRACDPNTNRRYSSSEDLRQAILLIQAGKSVRRLHLAEKSLRRAARWLLFLALIATIGLSGAYLERKRADASERLLEYSALLTQTVGALDRGDYASALSQLEEAADNLPPQLPHPFEWRALAFLAKGDPSETWLQSGPAIRNIAASPDTRRIAIHDASNTLTIRNSQNGKVQTTISNITQFAGFSENGTQIIGLDSHHHPARWRLNDTTAPETLSAAPPFCWSLGLDRNDTFAAIVPTPQLQILKWPASSQTGETIPVDLPSSPDTTWNYFRGAHGPQGEIALAWVSLDGNMPRFLLTHWTRDSGFTHTPITKRPSAVGFDSLGAWASMDISGQEFRADADGVFKKTNTILPSRTILRKDSGPHSEIIAHDQHLTWCQSNPFAPIRTVRGHLAQIKSFAVNEDFIYSGSAAGDLKKWALSSSNQANLAYQAWDSNAFATHMLFIDDTKIAVSKNQNNSALVDINTMQEVGTFPGIRTPVFSMGETLVGESEQGFVKSTTTLRTPSALPTTGRYLRSIIAPKTQQIYAIDENNNLCRIIEGKPPEKLADGWMYHYSLQTNPDGSLIWYLSNNATINCYQTATRTTLWSAPLPDTAPRLCPSPNYESIYTVTLNGRLQVHDAQTGELLRSSPSGQTSPEALALSHLGDRIFVGGRDGEIQIFDTKDLRFLCTLKPTQRSEIFDLALSPNDTALAILSKTGLLQVIHAPPKRQKGRTVSPPSSSSKIKQP